MKYYAITVLILGICSINLQAQEENLEPVLKEYFEKNQSDAIIALKTNEKAKYRVYKDVVQLIEHQILILKKELAEAKFKKSFEELNEEEMTLVNSTYPLVVIE